MSLDFSFNKYEEILDAIARSQYPVFRVADYVNANPKPNKFIIIRHDVDLDPVCQLKYAKLEHDRGIHTSYYFRHVNKIFNENIISNVYSLGHEVGYHYEVFTKAKGNSELAISLFSEEQAFFKNNWNSSTVCPHGGSFNEEADGYKIINMFRLIPKIVSGEKVFADQVNFNMWEGRKFEEFGIIGDAYHSINFCDILYLSDTGRSWNQRYKRLDRVDSMINPQFAISSSNDIIDVINCKKANKIYLLVHFEQWKDNVWDWGTWYFAQLLRRLGKRLIFGRFSNLAL